MKDLIDLSHLVQGYQMIRPYQREEHEALVFKLMDSSPMQLPGLKLIYDRRPEFEALLKLQAPYYQTIVGEENKELLGLFSLSWGPRYVQGEIKTVSYIGDFRIQSPRMAAKLWRKFYPEFITKSLEQGIDHHLTAILKDNHAAIRNLVYSGRNRGFHYRFLTTIDMVNTFGRKPLHSVQGVYPIQVGGAEDKIQNFLDSANRRKLFGYVFSGSEWEFRKRTWPQWKLENFLQAIGPHGEILAVCLPWAPSSVKRMRAEKVKPFMKLFLQTLRMIGLSAPKEGEDIHTLYLTHMAFAEGLSKGEKAQIAAQFLVKARELHGPQYQMVSFADEAKLHLEEPLRALIQQVIGVNLYSVIPSQTSEEKSWPKSGPDQSIGFEMALV